MENRWSMRKPMQLDVDLYYRDWRVSGCKTRDLGLGGVFVEMTDPAIPSHSTVELVLKYDHQGAAQSHRFRGNVVHRDRDGLGVAFRDFDVADVRTLQQML